MYLNLIFLLVEKSIVEFESEFRAFNKKDYLCNTVFHFFQRGTKNKQMKRKKTNEERETQKV